MTSKAQSGLQTLVLTAAAAARLAAIRCDSAFLQRANSRVADQVNDLTA